MTVDLSEHAPYSSTPVAYLISIYLLGGDRKMLFDDTFYSDEKDSFATKHVFCFDFDNLEKGWADATPMTYGRYYPSVVAFKGKIYALGGNRTHFAEVFDSIQRTWVVLEPPFDSFLASPYVLLDSSPSQILVHCNLNDSLYAYNVANEAWDCLIENYGEWSTNSLVVDGVIYNLVVYNEYYYTLSATGCSLRAYGVDEKKELGVSCLLLANEARLPERGAHLYHLGNHNFCLAGYDRFGGCIRYIKFSVCKCEDSRSVIIRGPAAELLQSIAFKDDFRKFV